MIPIQKTPRKISQTKRHPKNFIVNPGAHFGQMQRFTGVPPRQAGDTNADGTNDNFDQLNVSSGWGACP